VVTACMSYPTAPAMPGYSIALSSYREPVPFTSSCSIRFARLTRQCCQLIYCLPLEKQSTTGRGRSKGDAGDKKTGESNTTTGDSGVWMEVANSNKTIHTTWRIH